MNQQRAVRLADPADRDFHLARVLADWRGDRTSWCWFGGTCFAVPGDVEPLRQLFRIEGFTATRLVRGAAGDYVLRGHQVALVKALDRDEYPQRWENPYSGRTRDCPQDLKPLDLPPPSPLMPWFITDDSVILVLEGHAGAPQAPRRESSMRQFVVDAAQLADRDRPGVHFVGTWQRAEGWPDWMGMDGIEGYLFARLFMRKYTELSAMPAPLLAAVAGRLPGALAEVES